MAERVIEASLPVYLRERYTGFQSRYDAIIISAAFAASSVREKGHPPTCRATREALHSQTDPPFVSLRHFPAKRRNGRDPSAEKVRRLANRRKCRGGSKAVMRMARRCRMKKWVASQVTS